MLKGTLESAPRRGGLCGGLRGELLAMLVGRNLKIRYKHSTLGFFWSLLTPGLMILMYVLFARILRFSGSREGYLAFLVTGIVVWQYTNASVNDALSAIAGNANLVKKVAFPRIILPTATAVANGVNFLLTLAILGLYLALSGALRWSGGLLLWLPLGFALQAVLVQGLTCLAATANVFFRDTQHMVGVGTQAWFFLSPIFYPVELQTEALPAGAATLVYLNPMTGVLALYRAALLGDALPRWDALGLSAAVCLAVLLAGLVAVRCGNRRFGDIL